MDQRFERAVAKVLAHEGGYVDDPHDPGGRTKYGISQRSYPDVDIAALTVEDAKGIYHRDWWVRYRFGEIVDIRLAAKAFDLAVNMGANRAIRLLQTAVNRVNEALRTEPCERGVTLMRDSLKLDGVLGPKTLGAVNHTKHPSWLLAELELAAVAYYESLGKARYLRGWVRRALD